MNGDTGDRLDEEIQSWADSIAPAPEVRVEIYRLAPTTWRGRSIPQGKIGHFDELVELEDLKNEFGGGKYRLIVKRPDSRGRLTYRLCRTLEIAGPPRVTKG